MSDPFDPDDEDMQAFLGTMTPWGQIAFMVFTLAAFMAVMAVIAFFLKMFLVWVEGKIGAATGSYIMLGWIACCFIFLAVSARRKRNGTSLH